MRQRHPSMIGVGVEDRRFRAGPWNHKADGRVAPTCGRKHGPSRFVLAGVGLWSYRDEVDHRRHTWLRPRKVTSERSITPRREDQEFRSDNDLYQWWMWGRVAVPMTILCYGALRHFGVPFDYTPLATLPAIALYLALRVKARRDRKAGKRFDQYDTDDISW